MMTPREIVERCIEFRDPPRIGLHFKVLPINGRVWPETDFALLTYRNAPDFVPTFPGANEWGYKMETFDPTGENMGQVKEHPLGGGWHQLETFAFPHFDQPDRYAHLKNEIAGHRAQGLYVYGSIPTLMESVYEMRGMENFFMDVADEPPELKEFISLLLRARLEVIEQYAALGLDGAISWDDMGINDRAMISPAAFRQLFFPAYKATCDALHERGMHFIHHCCGQVRDFVPMFHEAGCDVLQLDQPRLMGIDWLAEKFGGKLCFWCPVDIQQTITRTNAATIEAEAHELVWKLGNFGGGFMVKAYEQPKAIDMNETQAETQYRAFCKYSRYPLLPYRANCVEII
jgi:uroporphyrinogen decarboxylase